MGQWLRKYYIGIILLVIFLYCGFILFYQLGYQSFWIDEGYSSYVSKYMSINGLYKSSYFLFEWLQVLCFKIGGLSDYMARFPSVIFQLVSVFMMYYIAIKFCKNKYVGLLSAAIFGLLYRELGRGRDARFYSLVQCMFLFGMFLIEKWLENGSVRILNLVIILIGVGVVLHPFLGCLCVVLCLAFLSKYKKSWDIKSLFSRKYLSTRILLIIGLILVLFYSTLGGKLNGSLVSDVPWEMKKYYFNFYNNHLWSELGMIYIFGIIGMIWFVVRRRIKEIILIVIPSLFFFYAIVMIGYLMHSRYALLLFPLMILSTCILLFDIFKLIKNKWVKTTFFVVCLVVIGFTSHFQFIPTKAYYFDFTSPQPDFKSAYAAIPDGSNVVSGFPTLCDWYYSDRGTCINAIRVDLIHDGKTKILTKKSEKYTKLAYINSLDDLKPGLYYFVIDDLTFKSRDVNTLLYDQIFGYGEEFFVSGEGYNNIVVMKIKITN